MPNLAYYLMWLAGFIVAVMLVGFWIAITGFFLIFLRVRSDASWIRILIMTVGGVGFITALSWIMVLDFPGAIEWVGIHDDHSCSQCAEYHNGILYKVRHLYRNSVAGLQLSVVLQP